MMKSKYKIGDEIQLISDPNRIGTIVEVCEIHAGIQYYRVNFGTTGRPIIAEIDLRPFVPAQTPSDNLEQGKIDGYQEFQRLITFQRLLKDNPLRNNIYAFNASRTRFYPYQFKPLLKFLDAPKHRLLIADEVGLGKTIEAGLILTELRARQTMQRILVVCPANLNEKWQLELKRRFGEEFEILNAQRFLDFLQSYERSPYDLSLNGIISMESIRQQRVLEMLEALSPSFDLVIIDEAHHMRNLRRKQRKVGVLLADNADAMLLLTATPIHLGNENLFSLLNILDEEEFPDLYTVDLRFRDNEPIVKAQICMGQIPPNIKDTQKLLRSLSISNIVKENPLYNQIKEKLKELEDKDLNINQKRRLILDIQRELAELNLIGHIFNRTKKREVHTGLAKRRAYPLRMRLTEIERNFYEAVTDYVRNETSKRNSLAYIEKWILHMPQRRMASSIPAMVEHYRRRFKLNMQDLPEDYFLIDESIDSVNQQDFDFHSAEERLKSIIQKWPSNGHDSKYEKFIEILKELKKREGNLKIMVFAFFKGTLQYLQKRLENDGFKSRIISGDVKPADRILIVDEFKNCKFEILLSSKVGSEGLDFQFCDTLFNYDLPWNPMEVEQRIGRLDRIGQESPIVRIYNFWIEDTIEQRIMDRLYTRIGIFEKSIGELEMILGDELNTLEHDILSNKLTPEDEKKLIEQKARVIESRYKELKNLEKKAAEFIGTDQYFDEEVQMIKEKRRYITGEQMRKFIVDFIRINCSRTQLTYDPIKQLGTIKPDDKLRSLISLYDPAGDISRILIGAGGDVPITFDSQTAYDNPNVQFINVLHPLPQAIARYYSNESGVQSNAHHVVLKTNRPPKGFYFYFIYRLRVIAARNRNTLEMILLDENLESPISEEDTEVIFGEMVENGEDSRGCSYEVEKFWLHQACQKAERLFLERIAKIRNEVERNNDAFINLRLESLKTSYGKILTMKKELLKKAEEEGKKDQYIRMLKGSIRNLEYELKQKQEELEKRRIIGVEHDEISAGILEII